MATVNTITTLKCPRDGTDLIKSIKNGVEIEYCPTCGGVWLDHGELEKLIALASQPKFGPPSVDTSQHSAPNPHTPSHNTHSSGYSNSNHNQGYHHKKKKENWLGDMFDF